MDSMLRLHCHGDNSPGILPSLWSLHAGSDPQALTGQVEVRPLPVTEAERRDSVSRLQGMGGWSHRGADAVPRKQVAGRTGAADPPRASGSWGISPSFLCFSILGRLSSHSVCISFPWLSPRGYSAGVRSFSV